MPDNQTNKQPRLWTNIFIRVGIVTALAGVCRQMYMSAFPQYLADQIHHSELGGKQYAETIWDELKNIHCNSDVSVD